MIQTTQGLVLRTVKYGETSLVCTILTRTYGVQTYMLQGVRSATKGRQSRAGMLQPAMILEIVVYHKTQKSMQRIKEFTPLYFYMHLQEDIIRNTIALFSIELLLRLLPQDAPVPELYDFITEYFRQLDQLPAHAVANFPVYFLIQCGRYLGYELHGTYSEDTPYLNLQEGAYTAHMPPARPFVAPEDAEALVKITQTNRLEDLYKTEMNAAMRIRLMEWYLEFLHRHTEHMTPLKSLAILQAILH